MAETSSRTPLAAPAAPPLEAERQRQEEERAFIHALSSPLTVALMHNDHILANQLVSGDVRTRLEKIMSSLRRMESEIMRRRDVLISRESEIRAQEVGTR